ncbi:UPF0711 protein C18orf21 homolog [Dreissena polymorpha]|uniref:Uncharacterized protein n=1 Tax=Dreissena polymorpha TaxID=45954 RepID=A0A9D4N7S3_DREPO|nr:UPF0711 protein C18orf21 homolog [Dreissena polymorpha]KAH3888282.1 hypothetical protein DPMN_012314 [Dreissena polymorpha]
MAKMAKFYEDLITLSNSISPGLARYFQYEAASKQEGKGVTEMFRQQICFFCGNRLMPGNYQIRMSPRCQLTTKVKRLIARSESKTPFMGRFQKKLLKDYMESCNMLRVTCQVCKKTMLIPGQSRAIRLQGRQIQKQVEVAATVKSKRQKKREKATARMKRKLDDDSNAGLSLPGHSTVECDASNSNERKPTTEDICTLVGPDQHTSAVSNTILPIHQPPIKKPVLFFNQPKVKRAQECVSLPSQSSTNSSKKKKTLKRSKQLSQMLRKEKLKQDGSGPSLTDFLSSL